MHPKLLDTIFYAILDKRIPHSEEVKIDLVDAFEEVEGIVLQIPRSYRERKRVRIQAKGE